MRLGYLIPLSTSLFFVWKLQSLVFHDILAMVILCLGTILIVIAKKDLGKRHSWAGYASVEIDSFCLSGVYAWIRHPIYLGIMIVDIGFSFIIIPNFDFNLQLALTFLIGTFFTFIFLVISSLRETKFLAEKFGQPFKDYSQQVYSFFPLRKYINPTDTEYKLFQTTEVNENSIE